MYEYFEIQNFQVTDASANEASDRLSGNEAGNDRTLPTTGPSNVFEEKKEEREKGGCLSGEVHAPGNYPSGSLIRVLK